MRPQAQMEPLILASASPRRSDLLKQASIPFIVHPSDVDEENACLTGNPSEKAETLAYFKAKDVSGKVNGGIVLGADTIVVLDDVIYGKPADDEEAFSMLSSLSGREHSVITGIALVDEINGKTSIGHELTRVRFAKLSSDEINYYIATGEPVGKAGAYAVQGIGAMLVEGIDGCYSNVVGLPLMKLRKMLDEMGIHLMA